jgi:hypothetical protein
VTAFAALAVLTACGGDEDAKAAIGTDQGVPATVACPADAKAIAVPAGFAAPLPDGTVVVAAQKRSDGRTVLTGVVPTAEKQVLAQLQQKYPAAGLQLSQGETEERDAESNFSGGGQTGRWGIRVLPDCSPEATRIDLVVRAG